MSVETVEWIDDEIETASIHSDNLKNLLESIDPKDDELIGFRDTVQYSLRRVINHKQNLLHVKRRVEESNDRQD